jgi:hypothetical protein
MHPLWNAEQSVGKTPHDFGDIRNSAMNKDPNKKDFWKVSSGGDLWGDNSVRWDHQTSIPAWFKLLTVGIITVLILAIIGLVAR